MGAWGYWPQDSDGAMDIFATVDDAISAHLTKLYERKDYINYWNTTGVVVRLLHLHYIDEDIIRLALKCAQEELTIAKNDKTNDWKDKKKAVKIIRLIVSCLTVLLDKKETYGYPTSKSKKKYCISSPVELDDNLLSKSIVGRTFIELVRKQLPKV